MSGDYLWDRSGDDEDVAGLEGLLGTYAHRAPLTEPPPRRPRRGRIWLGAGVVAAVAVAAIVVVVVRRPDRPPAPIAEVAACEADTRGFAFTIDGGPAQCSGTPTTRGTLPVGGWLETPADSTAELQIADIGEVRLAGASRLRLVASGPTEHRLELASGRMSARVSAPPRLFVVDTPTATAFDLGCAYDLAVEPGGRTRLTVTHGAVSLEGHGRTAFVPWGTEVLTLPGRGPGTPVAIGAVTALVDAVAAHDRGDPAALATILALAGENDAITVFNLLANAPAAARAPILDRLDVLTPRPEWVLTEDLLAGKPAAYDAWRDSLTNAWFAPNVPIPDEPKRPGKAPPPGKGPPFVEHVPLPVEPPPPVDDAASPVDDAPPMTWNP